MQLPTLFPLLLLLLSTTTISTVTAANATVCQYTLYPSFCRSSLPITNSSANVFDYGRFSVRKSISAATKFSNLINKFLANPSALTTPAVSALRDCRYLADLNLEFLQNTFQTVEKPQPNSVSLVKSQDIQTMLSAILTNTQTCIDGIQATSASWSSKNGILAPLTNDNKLYSVSLALFNRGWGHPKNKNPSNSRSHHRSKLNGFSNGRLPLKMSDKTKAVFETVGRRKLLQSDDQVVVSDIVVVSQDGSGNFTTIMDAVNIAPNKSQAADGYFMIYVTAGVYEEYVNIPKNKVYLMIIGDGINQTVITGNRSVVDGWTTFNSATFIVTAPYFVAVNITIRNTAGAVKHQAVALRSGADLSTFYSCSFEAYQDTLYTHSLRQFYRECDVYGTVDFIFGNAAVVFQNCNLYPRQPMSGQFNAITAQGRTDPGQNTGTIVQNCSIRAAEDLGSTKTYLGRPWKEYSRTVYMKTFMDSSIDAAGWREWSGDFALNTSYYAEFENSGPGSDTSGRVNWDGFHILNATEASGFTASVFIPGDDFIPQTGVPYEGGL
ncbi:hypothetical protein OSB04_022822 [Centaurea solstitialis]|uniref:Pectinesterase n=1 Tax=Centaurea solstitialis TaxID=347529 RepID=A0AA38SVF0_9ASTR|nr:hypothetical protein OSB04_022822 [Centaurea solstitialis]